eukprot:266110-Rhodomonas_salina.3
MDREHSVAELTLGKRSEERRKRMHRTCGLNCPSPSFSARPAGEKCQGGSEGKMKMLVRCETAGKDTER